jgi:type IV pilus assembly protein PilO
MNIDFKDPRFLRWAIAILLVVVAVPLDFTSTMYPFTYASRTQNVEQLERKHQELSRDLEKARLLVANLDRVEQEYEILREQWQVAQTLLPEENEMPNLLRKVTAAGQQSGVEFDLFRPRDPLPRDFYTDNPVEVRVAGGFHQTGVFLSRLANLNRIVNVADLQMSGLADQSTSPATVETSFLLTAYTHGGAGPGPSEPGTQRKLAAASGTSAAKGQTAAQARQ